ncbi:drug resistance transporter, EmrB/QacA subfamily [Gordonia malaquae]|uniref:Putative drug resistance transporter n=2 Tax=Gordonia TaxID=2053 RepID=M3VFA2_GORML|nr:putative drug resistance transporter [Gordonia malaquae NBRC 108250]SEB82154.1 drug resistance transporter, EmrB/QacA subfamily [Gordonia malaquae]
MVRVDDRTDDKPMTFRTAWLILIACSAVSLVVAAMAALNTALPGIAADTGSTNSQMTWILDSYTLVLAALLLPAGAIGDRFGRRGVLLVGLVIFGIGSLSAIWVDGPTELIATRIVAGAGAALIMPTTLSLITAGVPRERRAVAISIWAAVAGAGAIAGFFVTGVLLNFFHWHSVFITFAVSTTVVLALTFTIGTSKDENPGRFDIVGSLTSMAAVAGVVFGLLEAPHRGWADPLILLCLIGGAALVAVFIVVEHRRTDPLLDVDLFRNRAFASGSLSVGLQFLASFGVFFLVLQQLQLVFGYSPLKSAVALFPMVAGVGLFAMIGNWVAVRYSLKFVLGVGVAIAALGVLLLGIVETDEYWKVGALLGVCAIGIGLATAPSTTAIMSNTPLENQGVGSAVNDTARELGAAIGIALAGSIMAAGYEERIGATADAAKAQIGMQDPAAASAAEEAIRGSLAGAVKVSESLPPEGARLAEAITSGAQAAFLPPMQTACLVLGGVLAAGAVFLGWFTPRDLDAAASPEA